MIWSVRKEERNPENSSSNRAINTTLSDPDPDSVGSVSFGRIRVAKKTVIKSTRRIYIF